MIGVNESFHNIDFHKTKSYNTKWMLWTLHYSEIKQQTITNAININFSQQQFGMFKAEENVLINLSDLPWENSKVSNGNELVYKISPTLHKSLKQNNRSIIVASYHMTITEIMIIIKKTKVEICFKI